MSNYKYALRYTVDFQSREKGYFKKDVETDKQGLTDAAMIVSIIKPKDGSYSQMLMTHDGQTKKPLTQKDIFKVWLTLGISLSDTNELKGWHKEVVDSVTRLVRDMLAENRN
jgi:hypothetical protein